MTDKDEIIVSIFIVGAVNYALYLLHMYAQN